MSGSYNPPGKGVPNASKAIGDVTSQIDLVRTSSSEYNPNVTLSTCLLTIALSKSIFSYTTLTNPSLLL
jgi:hypothetical protein